LCFCLRCRNWEETQGALGALERGSCFVGSKEVVVSIYDSHEEAAGEPAAHAELLAGVSDTIMVVGENWTLSCEETSICERIESDFGGELVIIPA
ncbi:hypothetical protein AB0M20_32940, partial [Actinoplanes sp. NPDC051633]